LLVAKRDLKLKALLKRLAKFEVPLIDDMGYVQAEPRGDGGAVHAAGEQKHAGSCERIASPEIVFPGDATAVIASGPDQHC